MSDETPLAVLVAKAIGWTDIQWTLAQGAWGRHPSGRGGADGEGYGLIPRYGFDSPDGWSCTGPLLSEHRLDMEAPGARLGPDASWLAQKLGYEGERVAWVIAPSAPEAIARLVVKLAEMGKLEKA